MIFNTWTFALFGLSVYALYWKVVPKRARSPFLAVAGIVFYAFSVPGYLAIIAALGAITFGAGTVMIRAHGTSRERSILFATVSLIALVLGIFKYSHFFALTVNQIAARNVLPLPNLVVPLAISFFTFEFVHVLVDVRAGKIRKLDPLDFATFTLFFPTLVAGPIKRYQSFVPQLHSEAVPSVGESLRNLYRIALGTFKKIVIADSLTLLTQPLLSTGEPYHRLDYWVAFFAYSGKIYFDFTGYSDIAIGVAGLLGFRIPENFDRPYRSTNIAAFWRRWHISLSTWIRDYIFIPLGGSRRPAPIVALNLFLAMTLAGLWHGAAWTFVVWGLWHGLGLVAHRVWAASVVPRVAWLRDGGSIVRMASVGLTYVFVCVGWVVFATTSLPQAFRVYRFMLAS